MVRNFIRNANYNNERIVDETLLGKSIQYGNTRSFYKKMQIEFTVKLQYCSREKCDDMV